MASSNRRTHSHIALAVLLSGAVLLLLLLGVTHHHHHHHNHYTYSHLGGRRSLLYSGGNALYWDSHEQYTNLQLSRDIDASIEARAHDQDQHGLPDDDGGRGRTKQKGGKCSRLFLYLPDMFSLHGHGSQIQLYITGVVASTYLDRAMLVVDPPVGQDINLYEGGSQFGCPIDAFLPSSSPPSSSENTNKDNNLLLREKFPTGLSRLIHQPTWLARGCELPTTCNGKAMLYDDWIRLARKQPRTLGNLKKFQFNELSCTNDDGSIANIIVTGGRSLRLYHQTLARVVMTSSSSLSQQQIAKMKNRWAINLGASPIEANRFANIVDTTKVWDYVLGLLNRSGFVKFQPWIARDVEALLQSYDIPRTLGTTYAAIHVRRGDKLTEEARHEVIQFWTSQGYADSNNLPTDYVPFRQYLAQWDGPELCPIDPTTGQQVIVKHNVYIATDDPIIVQSGIESMPERVGPNVILWNICHELTFYFNPTTTSAATENAFHLNGNGEEGFHDEGVVDTCHQRYHRNIVSIVDMFLLCRAQIFIGEYNSNWGRVIREMRVRLSGNNELIDDASMLAYTLDTRIAWGSDKPSIPGVRRGLFSFNDNDYKTVSPRKVQPLVVTESSDAAVTLPTTTTTKARLVMMTSMFGTNPLPPYFPMFLRSIQRSGADGIVIGGDAMELKDMLPPNVRHIPLTWDGLHDLISNKLFNGTPLPGFQAATPYKVNDVKPLYGFLFREYIREYEFWAYVDNDLIFGDVAGILNPLMDRYDVLTPIGHGKTSGPFTAYRNTPQITELFRSIDGDLYYDALNNSTALAIDEWGQLGGVYSLSMSSVVKKHQSTFQISPSFTFGWDGPDEQNPKLDCVWKQMKDGRAALNKLPHNPPVLYCHYQYSKKKIADILSNTDQEAILGADSVMWSANTGLTVLYDPM